MEPSVLSSHLIEEVSEFVADKIGLYFPPNRWGDLQRGLIPAMSEMGFTDLATFVDRLLSTPLTKQQVDVLASHLTVGETYFFREKKTLEVLAERVLPELIRSRRNNGRRLRLWSAGCCTGEEPYSLVILLQQAIPDLKNWRVGILATDINPGFLRKAAGGVYGEWSFRQTPAWFKERYFKRTPDGRYEILPEIKRFVTFAQLNLVADPVRSLMADTNAMDLIFCRNVLMYFSPRQAQKVVRNLWSALVDGGWLVVGCGEGSPALLSKFVRLNVDGVTLYQKSRTTCRAHSNQNNDCTDRWASVQFVATSDAAFESGATHSEIPLPDQAMPNEVPDRADDEQLASTVALYQSGRYAEAVDTLLASVSQPGRNDPEAFSLLVRSLANQGKLDAAVVWCDRWLTADKLNSAGHYLRAVILQELGETEEATRSLRRTLYLNPQFVLAHFALGNLMRSRGKAADATRYFANASTLLRDLQADDVLPESDGLTAGRLSEILNSIIEMEVAS
jgi:chemotaxis protein methyltransferase CheR